MGVRYGKDNKNKKWKYDLAATQRAYKKCRYFI